MNQQQILQNLVLPLINEVLKTSARPPILQVEPSQNLISDLGLDSLELAELTVRIEAETGVDLFKDGVVRTVGEVVGKLRCS